MFSSLIPLALLLWSLGAPPLPGAADLHVSFAEEGPPGLLGVACSQALFGDVEENAQALCDGLPDGTVLLLPAAWETREKLLNVLAHEAAHFALGVDPTGETAYARFRERASYEAGCSYSYIPDCRDWLR